ncbi:hypothetical protein E2C01_061340 [Portunus trituberculatus]|uniref:Uncharacterized protein n=1 Tax=Portunus trituberculatus TaxID=210409 RepID=A0A5B7HES6_PORTR|nr:hypothetical protein [Portunus trituberculatus]
MEVYVQAKCEKSGKDTWQQRSTDLCRGVARVEQEWSRKVQPRRCCGSVEVCRDGELVTPQQTLGGQGAARAYWVQPWSCRAASRRSRRMRR